MVASHACVTPGQGFSFFESATMGPPRKGESVERTDEHEEFIKKVAEYHEKRGYEIFIV